MRWYRLRIGKDVTVDTLKHGKRQMQFQMEAQKSLPPRNNNPTPLNIQFNVTAMADLNAQVGSVVKIYNVDQNSFAKLREYTGYPIHLEAGFDSGSPMVQQLGYPTVMDKTIILGRVQSVIANFQANDPWIALSCGPYGVDNEQLNDISTLYNEIGGKKTQTAPVQIQIEPSPKMSMPEVLFKAFSFFLEKYWDLVITPGVAMTMPKNTQAMFNGIRTLAQLVSFLRTKLQIGTSFDYTCNKCLLYKCGSLNGDYGEYAELAELAGAGVGVKMIKTTEFLEQPEAIGINEITATIALRADLHLGSLVTLVGMVPQMGSFAGMDSFISKGVCDNIKLFNPGVYMVIGINHNGDFYGTSPTSWSTQLRMVYVDGKVAAEAAKNKAAKTEKSKGVQK